ncbi:MAG: DUF6443 domain-containing protein, partial [Prevotellaceae bacterium]|nr:DUF6443 domain-containing protein [Prevotellaceae bacterium]
MKTKQIFLLAIFGMYCSSVFAQSAGRTYILTRTYTAHTIKVAPSDPDPSLPTDPTPIRPKPIKPLPIIPEPEPEPEPFPIRPRPINPVLPVNPIPVKPWPIVPDPILPIKPIPIKPDPIVPEPVLPIYPTPFKPDPLVPFPNQPSIVIFDPTITIASLYPDLFPALNNQKSDSLASEYIDVIQYFDRFGCPVETVQKVFTPSGGDLITVQEYDGLFREIKTWLPAVKNTGNGAYVEPSLITDELVGSSLYDGDVRPYSEIRYDASPLNLIVEQHRQGNDWFAQGRSIKTDRISNTGTSGEFACARYEAGGTRTAPTLKKTGYYATGELRVRKTTDEDNNVSYEFKDKADRTILTRRINEGQAHDTYFVYDKYGNPNFVLPPLSSDALTAVNVVWTETAAALKSYAYIYKYDKYNRRIATKLPGCDWTYFVYDKADRLIFSQNGEQRKRSEWTFSIPDAFGRTVLTGTCKNSPNWAADDPLGASAVVKATRTNSTNAFKGYSISGVTLNTPTILTTDWYDDYSFMNFNGIPSSSDVDFKYESVSGYGDQYTGGYKGMLTGSWRALLDGSTNGMFSIMYYDYRGRMIQSKAKNHLGGVDKGYLAYNFTGQTIKMKTAHSATVGGTQQIEEYLYTYDHAGRLTKTALAINGDTTTIAENTYDELGRLKENKKGGNETLKTTYAYNVRSWTKSITGSLFNQTLYYNDSYGGNTKRYGGDVSAMSWKQSNEAQPRGYAFAYDGLSRLTAANYLVNGAASNNYKTSYTYDKHGNLKTLQRYGKTTAANYGIIDNLTSILDGNRITKITDAVTNVFTPESADFKDYSNGAGQYLYDSNGSLTEDTHKGILGISYNVLNLPRELAIKNTIAVGKTYYVYSADGVKLQTKHLFGSDMNYTPIFGSTSGDANLNIVKTTDYVGNRVYENGSLKRVLFDGGYIEGGVFYYYITDH